MMEHLGKAWIAREGNYCSNNRRGTGSDPPLWSDSATPSEISTMVELKDCRRIWLLFQMAPHDDGNVLGHSVDTDLLSFGLKNVWARSYNF